MQENFVCVSACSANLLKLKNQICSKCDAYHQVPNFEINVCYEQFSEAVTCSLFNYVSFQFQCVQNCPSKMFRSADRVCSQECNNTFIELTALGDFYCQSSSSTFYQRVEVNNKTYLQNIGACTILNSSDTH